MREFIEENRTTLIVCIILIGIGVLVYIYSVTRKYFVSGDYEGVNDYLKNYSFNEVIPINITEEQMARKYLADYIRLIVYDAKRAYELVDEEYREVKFGTLENFKEFFNQRMAINFTDATLKSYSINQRMGYKEFYLKDANDNVFIFKEMSIMQYTVMFDPYTI